MHPLITPEALADALSARSATVVLDVRWRLGGPPGRQDYEVSHVPGAVYLDLDTELSAPPGAGGRHPLPEPERLQEVLRAAGVREGAQVVAYDAADGSVAARVWWLLRWAGFGEVAVLDGGFAAWEAAGLPVTAEVPAPLTGDAAGDVVVRPGQMPVLDADEAAALAQDGVLLDARAAARYRGETEPVDPKAGHIPGALNAPTTGHVGADGRWLGPEALAARFAGLGVSGDVAIGAYCGSGVTASSVVLALEVAGITSAGGPAALYAGSWSNWCALDREVATGG
ncbi:sulfurtransferase [Lentzea flaviverrucosa]|uniref:Thiosulfate/3-mercaptopyruvate sulfurtransferase n=1 Tax=Lentzea flaviverrucosa TaxID=200379 RepID=A0A1H9XX55_9PSEU|nr:sulfurtransferase [Lentzea flaviverrucosa]RDI17438.1 thiosulfate/3-mercaptopyruvate sulfurtransferase [Lentzea flaviverrucosa]SES50694.1 thiosulfate/3-mercaptopyruvate sulfurtransferase [Lentzea flaviverrucosa]